MEDRHPFTRNLSSVAVMRMECRMPPVPVVASKMGYNETSVYWGLLTRTTAFSASQSSLRPQPHLQFSLFRCCNYVQRIQFLSDQVP